LCKFSTKQFTLLFVLQIVTMSLIRDSYRIRQKIEEETNFNYLNQVFKIKCLKVCKVQIAEIYFVWYILLLL